MPKVNIYALDQECVQKFQHDIGGISASQSIKNKGTTLALET
jgi:hypothetical protein